MFTKAPKKINLGNDILMTDMKVLIIYLVLYFPVSNLNAPALFNSLSAREVAPISHLICSLVGPFWQPMLKGERKSLPLYWPHLNIRKALQHIRIMKSKQLSHLHITR